MTKSFDSSNFLISSVKTLGAFALVILLNACSFEASIKKPNPNTSSDAPLTLKIGDNTDNGSGNSITLLEVDEGSAVVFVVSQNKKRDANTELQISISGDLALISGAFSGSFPLSKTIPQGETSSTIVLSTVRDLKYSGPKTFDVVLSVPGTTVSTSFSLTLRDLDSAPVLAFSASSQNLSEGAGSGTATVSMSPASSESVSVAYSFINNTALNGSHYTGTNSSLVFAPGETSKTISFNLTNDAVSNSTRDFSIALGAVTGTASVGSPSSHTVNLLDNESPTLSIANVSGAQGGNVVFTVTLAPTSFQTVTVNYATANNTAVAGAHFTTTSGTLSFNAGESSKTITVPATSVSEVCGVDRVFDLNLSSAVNATIGINSATGTITDPKLPSLSVADSSATEGSNLVFTASLSQACASKTVSFDWATANGTALSGTDYGAVSSSGSITAGNTSASLTVSSINNGSYQGSRTFSVTLSNLNNASSGTLTATGTINDDETPMGVFNITGITSTLDVLDDAYLSNATSPTVGWGASTNATSYDVTIYQNDGTTVQCATQNTASTSLDMGGTCTLTPGQTYKAKVTAKNGAQTQDAANSLYSFYVNQSPVVGSGGEGPWYVMSGGAITINAQWAASPAVGVATDPESHVLNFTAAGAASLGTVDTSAGTSLTYTAGVNNGRDTFTYTITDDKGGKLTGTITIHVMKNFAWTGKTSTTWATASNWCGTTIAADKRSCNNAAAAPGASDTIYFDDTCVSSFTCTPTTAANISVAGVNIKANGFTQGNFNITTGASGWIQSGGTFTGAGAPAMTSKNITINGPFNQSGGTFTSTQSTLNQYTTFTRTGGTFNANSGTVAFFINSNYSITTGGAIFQNLKFDSNTGTSFATYNLTLTENLIILGNLLINCNITGGWTKAKVISSGPLSIDLHGNITLGSAPSSDRSTTFGDSSLTVNLVGSSDQSLTQLGNVFGAHLSINKPNGIAKLASNFTFGNQFLLLSGQTFDTSPNSGTNIYNPTFSSNFTVQGTFLARTSTVIFMINSNYSITTNGLTFHSVKFDQTCTTLAATNTLTINDDFTISGNLQVESHGANWAKAQVFPSGSRTIHLNGNIMLGSQPTNEPTVFGNNSLTVNMIGSADQTFSQTGNRFLAPVVFSKPGGISKLNSDFQFLGGINLTTGQTFDTSPDSGATIYNPTFGNGFIRQGTFLSRTSTVTFLINNNYSITTGGQSFYSVKFDHSHTDLALQNTLTLNDDFTILGNLIVESHGANWANSRVLPLGTRTINLEGNIVLGSQPTNEPCTFGNNSLTVNLVGTSNQTLSKVGNNFNAALNMNNTSASVDLTSGFSVGAPVIVSSGTFNMNAFAFTTTSSLTLESGTIINRSGGTLTYGSLINNGGTINP